MRPSWLVNLGARADVPWRVRLAFGAYAITSETRPWAVAGPERGNMEHPEPRPPSLHESGRATADPQGCPEPLLLQPFSYWASPRENPVTAGTPCHRGKALSPPHSDRDVLHCMGIIPVTGQDRNPRHLPTFLELLSGS